MDVRRLIALINPEFVGPEVGLCLMEGDAQSIENRAVEGLGGLQIPGAKVDMVDQTAAFQFHWTLL